MPDKNLEQFYDEVVSALQTTLTRVSDETWIPRSTMSKPNAHGAQPRRIPLVPRSPELKAASDSLFPFQPGFIGFQLVDITRLGEFGLIAFRWRETGDEIFVCTVNFRAFAEGEEPFSVHAAETIISMNLLERLGGQWYLHHPLRHIGTLTFMADMLGDDGIE